MKKPGFLLCHRQRILLALALLAMGLAWPINPAIAATDTFTANDTWTAPAGVTSVTVEAWGGGGAGGGVTGNPAKGGGGAGGQYVQKVVTVVPGTSYAIGVGSGGTGGTGNGGAGSDSTFASTTVVAKGGAGGARAASNNTGGAGGIGSAAGGVGDVVSAGGSGSAGTTVAPAPGGAGGGGAGSNGSGGSASANTAGTGTSNGGGDGGAGLSLVGNGSAGGTAGGGGSGAYTASSTDRSGGAGGRGQVIITYTLTPTVASINRSSYNPSSNNKSVTWSVVFNTSVTGVDPSDFGFTLTGGATGASVSSVTGSGTTWTVTANTGTANTGSVALKLVDDDSITDGSIALGGSGTGNGNFTGQAYTLVSSPCTGATDILFCDDFERANAGSVGNGWTVTPTNAGDCTGTGGNTGCAGIDADVPPWSNNATTLRPNPTRSMFTRWAEGYVTSQTVSLAGKAGAQLSFWIRRGQDTFSECPEATGENYLVQYYASDSTWKVLAQYPASPTADLCDGRIFTPTIELPPDALHAGFKIRFYQPSGSGDSGTSGGAPSVRGYDYWHMDDIVIREITAPTYTGAFCENFEAGLARWSITAEGAPSNARIGDASIGAANYQSPSNQLDLRWGYVSAASFKTDLTGISGNITYWIKSGTTADRDPDSLENLVVEYLNSAGSWVALTTYLGTAAAGSTTSATHTLPDDAKHAGFRLRFRLIAGSGYDKDYWHIDDVCVGNAQSNADLALAKTGSTVVPGTTTVYTLRASNNGPNALSGSMQIVDTLPIGLSYLGASGSGWSCSANAQVVTCNWSGTLANGAAAPDLLLTVDVDGGLTGSITNTATLTGTTNDTNLANNTASYTSGNFTPGFIFTSGACVNGIAVGQPGQSCTLVDWSGLTAGQTKRMYLTAVNTSGVPTALNAAAATTVGMQFGLTCHDPIADAGVQASFTAASPATLPLCSGSGAEPTTQWTTSRNFTFGANAPSVATDYAFSYADVGQIELWMRNAAATGQRGTSGTFVQKPAGFTLSEIKPSANAAGRCAVATSPAPTVTCAAVASDAAKFVAAGESFSATVTALTSTGVAAPNYGKEKIPEGVLLSPANAAAGMVTAPDIIGDFGAFSGGVATGTAFSWPEVGIITVNPIVKDGNYLGVGNVTGSISGNVGRFYPDHFDTTVVQTGASPAIMPMLCPSGLTCPTNASGASGMVYSGQPFALQVTAKNAVGAGATTVNYQGSFARAVTLSAVAAVGSATTNPGGGTLASTVLAASAFTSGNLGVLPPNRTYTLPGYAGTPVVAPTDFYVRATESAGGDGVTSLRTVAASSNEAGLKVAYGRVSLPNLYGSELLPAMCMTAAVQYFTGTLWTVSATDNATTLSLATPVIVKGPLAAAGLTQTFAANSSSACPVGNDACGLTGAGMFCAGQKYIRLEPAGVSGSANIALTVPSYLPSTSGRATFGIFKSPLIYRRENY